MNAARACVIALSVFSTVRCMAPPTNKIMAGSEQVALRSYQTRSYAATDRTTMLRTVIATLQDLGFIVDQALRVTR